MCGISGFIDFNKKSTKETLVKMTDAMLHRGPDDSGYEVWESEKAKIGFGQRRLSIIDLSLLGHQPMQSADGRWKIVFNGEIYNYKEIQKELIDLGYTFKSNSDTEVIIYAFDKWGKQAVHKFIGMFAFALYDLHSDTVSIYRDRAGVKPLYYYYHNGLFLFASELKAFHEHLSFEKKIDFDALNLYLTYGYIPAPHCIFKHCYKLIPGSFLQFSINNADLTIHKYWDVYDYYAKPALNISEQEAIIETERLLVSACAYRMVADVPVGVFLSGGYDSTTVAALLQKDSTGKIKTFTIGFHEKGFDEAPFAKAIAKHLGTEHTEYYCTAKEAADIIPTLPFYYDEPFADSSVIPTTLVSKMAKNHVTVALSADAGDEIFAGYNKYSHLKKISNYISLLSPNVSSNIAKIMDKINPDNIPLATKLYNFSTRYQKIKEILQETNAVGINKSISTYFTPSQMHSLLLVENKTRTTFFDEEPPNGQNSDFIQTILALDYKTYLVDDILTKVDRATMSVGLEGREPLLDHRIIEFAAQLPSHFKYNNGNKKYLLKQITHKYIPQSMLDRPKMGFGVPMIDWFKQELKDFLEYYFNEVYIKEQGVFNWTEIQSLIVAYQSGQSNYISKIWQLLMFQMWWEKWYK